MRRILFLFIMFLPVCSFALEIRSYGFGEGGKIPAKYTCDGEDVSPVLSWDKVPSGAKSFVLICSDPDAPFKAWTHWVMFNIPQNKRSLPEAVEKRDRLDDGSVQGLNDFARVGYGGPCPPKGSTHRYFFTLYCLGVNLDLGERSNRDDVLKAIKGHIIAEAKTFGVYGR